MIDKYFSWNIDGIQANKVLEGAEVSIPINREDYKDIIVSKDNILQVFKKLDEYLAIIFETSDKKLSDSIVNEFHLSYITRKNNLTDINEHYIEFDYNKIFNNVLEKLGLNRSVTSNCEFLKEDDFINQIKRELNFRDEIKDRRIDIDKEEIIKSLSKNISYVISNMKKVENVLNTAINKQIQEEKHLRENHKALAGQKEKHISWKNLMYYTAVKALNEFDRTDDIRYYRYAKNYYKNVADNSKAEYPSGLYIDGEFYDHQQVLFKKRFVSIRSHKFPSVLVKLGIEDKTTITLDRALKNGKGMRGKIESDEPKKTKKVDLSRVDETLNRKIKYYKGLSTKVQGIINGLDTDTDYIGYVLDNNYVIFDKFYDISKDGTKAVPSYGSAIYVVTLDVYEACDRNRAKIRKYISRNKDFKAFKWNHNDTDSYQQKIDEVVNYHDVSTIKFKELTLKHE